MNYDTNSFPMRDEIPGWENSSQEARKALTSCARNSLTAAERLRNGGQPDLADQVDAEIRAAYAEGQKAQREQLESIGAVADCPSCGGRGERLMGFMNGPDAYQDLVDCPDCKGTGYARVRSE